MSPINFADLARRYPEQQVVLKRLGGWLRKHGDPILYPGDLARQLGSIDAYDLASALVLLTRLGMLVQRFKVITPSGVYADGEYESLSQIPPMLRDRFNNPFDTAEADVTPVYRREGI